MTAPGNFGRSVGGAAGRGAMLVGAAVILGLILLRFAFDGSDTTVQAEVDEISATTVVGTNVDGSTVTLPSTPAADGTTASTVPATTAPAVDDVLHDNNTVTVMTANGSGTSGEAGRLAEQLSAENYVTDAANAEPTATTKIYYRPGYVLDARNIATVLAATADLIQLMPEAPALKAEAATPERAGASQIIIIIGSDLLIP